MAILPNGIFGHANGRLGNMVCYTDKFGRQICRTIGKKTSSKGGELGNQRATALVTELLKGAGEMTKIGFQHPPTGEPWHHHNYASSVNKKQAIKGEYPNQEIDYEKVVFAVGGMALPLDAKVTINNSVLEFTWDADLDTEGNFSRDQVMLVAHFPESTRSLCLSSGARRSEQKETIKLPRFTKEMVIETYLAFISDDRQTQSGSVYVGRIIWDKK